MMVMMAFADVLPIRLYCSFAALFPLRLSIDDAFPIVIIKHRA